MKIPSVGKFVISGVAAFTSVGAYLYDYNETHMFNPHWPPHAKFHDAQTISLGSLLGFLSLWALWRAPFEQGTRLRVATVLAGLYYVSQATSLLFPNVALVDPEFEAKVPKLFGRPSAQPVLDVTMLSLLAVAFALETRREPAA